MEDQRFDLEVGNRLYDFFLDILTVQKGNNVRDEENTYGSIWEFWEKEL
ncbi:hypothetical protein L3049_19790 [Labilibaculum sp. DW002]|uniref:Uncharacterized protein n=1 Tax=Paralabilibaculum antarcticum TaxID=2912572 RepID=A0ABT5VY93_9BACT|nr:MULTISPECIES: hypothetical protein [unclassified Labilibaculum]MBI9058805.1 hypothetical protein [Labilibaculum sp.]MDE5420240.1 hypothetical protein [Labilibaculum sp. DW002]